MSPRILLLIAAAACARADGRTDETSGAREAASAAPAASIDTPPASTPENDSLLERADLGRILGNEKAKVWMIVVSDFECPYCREFHEVAAPVIRKEYVDRGKIRLAYLNFPLGQHQHAWPAAEVAMCAGEQGKFWPVHDAIFATQRTWVAFDTTTSKRYFDSLAVAQKVDPARLRQCVSSRVLRPLIQADYDRSRRSGVSSTPTVIIGDLMMPGVYPLAEYRRQLDSLIAIAAPSRAKS